MLNHQFRDPPWPACDDRSPAKEAEIDRMELMFRRRARHIAQQLRIIRVAHDNIKAALDEDTISEFARLCRKLDTLEPQCWGRLAHPDDLLFCLEDIDGMLLNMGASE